MIIPSFDYNELQDCLDACKMGKLIPFQWQEIILRSWLGRNVNGRWSATTCGLSVARQNGKTLGTTEARMNYGLLILGEKQVYTAHLQKTATETFEDMANFFDCRSLRKYVKEIRTALGREQIIMKNGGRIKFLARTRNGGRGQHGDLLVFDEAQCLDDTQQASFLPAISASSNPQTIYTGTPPDEGEDGTVFRRIRSDALDEKTSRTAWAEWSVSGIGNTYDKARWYATNPSLGLTILETTIEGEAEQMSEDKFARERLGWWDKKASKVEHLIDADSWDKCYTDDPPEDGLMTVGIKFSVDGTRGSLAICLKPKNGVPYIEVIDSRNLSSGVGWFSRWILKRKNKIAAVSVDGKAGVSSLTTKLEDGKFPSKAVDLPNPSAVAAACSMLVNAVNENAISHFGQPDLDNSATKSAKRSIGKDGFGFDDTNEGDSTMIEACALAYRQAMTTKRRPGRRSIVY